MGLLPSKSVQITQFRGFSVEEDEEKANQLQFSRECALRGFSKVSETCGCSPLRLIEVANGRIPPSRCIRMALKHEHLFPAVYLALPDLVQSRLTIALRLVHVAIMF